MAEFESGPRVLHPQEEIRLKQIFSTHVIETRGAFDPRIGTFPMIDRWGVRSGDLNFGRLTLFNKTVLGKEPTRWNLEQAQLLWMQRIQRKTVREKVELTETRLVDGQASALVDVTSSGLVRLRSTDSRTGGVIVESFYEAAFFLAQQGINPDIDPKTLFIEVHPDYRRERLMLLRFQPLALILDGKAARPDFVLIDRRRNLVPRKVFTVRSLLDDSLDEHYLE